jgi:biopolymer transport protein ExbD
MADTNGGTFAGWPKDVLEKDAEARSTRKKAKRGRRKPILTPPISITSLTDMVTVLLVYLLKTFATNPVEVKDPNLDLPRSTCLPDYREVKYAKENDIPPRDGCGDVENTTLVMITGSKGKLTPKIVVNSQPVVNIDPTTYRVADSDKDPASGGWVISPLRERLRQDRKDREAADARANKKFDGKVVILADKETPYRVLSEVLVTCGDSGFGDFRFAVIKPE